MRLLSLLCYLCCYFVSEAQVVYFWNESTGDILAYNYLDCNSCIVAQTAGGSANRDDLLFLSNGLFLSAIYEFPNQNLVLIDPITGNATPIVLSPPQFLIDSYILFNGTVYIFAYDGLYTYDPASGLTQFVGGPWPADMLAFSGEFTIFNGSLLYIQGTTKAWNIDISNPSLSSVFVFPNPLLDTILGSTFDLSGETIVLTRGGGGIFLSSYNPETGLTAPLPCGDVLQNLPYLNINTIDGLTHLPAGVSPPPCLCLVEAGTVGATPQTVCLAGDITVPHNADEDLGVADVLNFILFTDPVDTLGSILIQQPGSVFTYDPNLLVPGTTYYLAAVAGPDAGTGLIDLSGNSGCIDLSEASTVVWQPVPEVVFVAGTTELCPEACVTITAQLIEGTPPFNVAGQLLDDTGSVVGSFNETILTTSGDFTVCAPPGVQGLTVQATQVGDAACGCS